MAAEEIAEKLPPQNIEAEMSVIASMLLEEETANLVIENLRPSDFYNTGHRRIFEIISSLVDKGVKVDELVLRDELEKRGILNEIGGVNYIVEIIEAVPSPANALTYAKIVKDKAILRAIINASTRILRDAYESGEDATELSARAEEMIFQAADEGLTTKVANIKDVLKYIWEKWANVLDGKGKLTGIPTGFYEFDSLTGGLHDSELIVIAARPSMGKTTFALNLAEHIGCREGQPVAFFSLEMAKEQLVQNMLCSVARVDAGPLREGRLSGEVFDRLKNFFDELADAPIYLDDPPGITITELRARARRLRKSIDVKAVFVDYLQLVRTSTRKDNREQEIAEISRGLKAMARELKIPVIAMSQLNRGVEDRSDHKPMLSDLRESGAIEQDADVVLLLTRDEYYDPEKAKGLAQFNLAKQRNGRVGSFDLAFIKEQLRFENLSFREE